MADQVLGISAADVPRVKRLLDAFEAGELNRQDIGGRRLFQNPVPFEFGFTNSAISAGSSGQVSLHSSMGDTTKDVSAISIRTVATAGNTKVKIWRHQRSGNLYFDAVTSALLGGGARFLGVVQPDTQGTGSSAWTKDVVAGVGGYDTVDVKRSGVGNDITVRLPHVGGASGREGPSPNLAAGNVIVFALAQNGEPFAGTCTANDATGVTMTQTDDTFVVNEFVGWTITNQTDGSTATVTSNTTKAIVATGGLSGGSDNEWAISDAFNMQDSTEAAVCLSGYLDDALGSIQIWNASAASIPFGWEEDASFTGRLAVGHDSGQNDDPDISTIGAAAFRDQDGTGFGETLWHHNEESPPELPYDHDDHELDIEVGTPGSGTGFFGNSDDKLEHTQALHAPPMRVVLFIIRIHE